MQPKTAAPRPSLPLDLLAIGTWKVVLVPGLAADELARRMTTALRAGEACQRALAFYLREVIQNGFAGMGWHSFEEAIAAPIGSLIGATFGAMLVIALWVFARRK